MTGGSCNGRMRTSNSVKHKGDLMVVTDQHDALETVDAVQRILQHQRDEGLHLEDLRRLLHDHIVVLERAGNKVAAGQRGVRARHGDDARLLDQQVARAVLLLQVIFMPWNEQH